MYGLPVCHSYVHHFLPMQRLVLQLVTSNKYKRKLNWESLLFRCICSQLRANGDRHFHCIERKASFPMKMLSSCMWSLDGLHLRYELYYACDLQVQLYVCNQTITYWAGFMTCYYPNTYWHTQVELILTTEDLLRSAGGHRRFITGKKSVFPNSKATAEDYLDKLEGYNIWTRLSYRFRVWKYFVFVI